MGDAEEREALLGQLARGRAELSELKTELRAWLELDLTMGQLRALVVLSRKQPTFVSDIANALGVSRPAASILVDRLVHLDLIGRREDPGDRRRTRVELTTRGRELVDQLLNGPLSIRDSMRRLPLTDLAALAQGMSALVCQIRIDAQSRSEPRNMATPHHERPARASR